MKVKFHVSLNLVGCRTEETVDIPDEDVEGMSVEEIETYLEEWGRDWLDQQIEWGFKIVEPRSREA